MHSNQPSLPPGRPSKEQRAMAELLSRINCNDRREPNREAEEYAQSVRRLTAVTFLSAVL
ncbi:hypothetical protein ACYBSK_18875 [Streptomyces sp. BYX5S]